MIMNKKGAGILAIVVIALVVAVIASVISASITGNSIKLNEAKGGKYQVYTIAEVDSKLNTVAKNFENLAAELSTPCEAKFVISSNDKEKQILLNGVEYTLPQLIFTNSNSVIFYINGEQTQMTEGATKEINGLTITLNDAIAKQVAGGMDAAIITANNCYPKAQVSNVTSCTDSDGGKNYYVKGTTGTGDLDTDLCFVNNEYNIFKDGVLECTGAQDCGLMETFCREDGEKTNIDIYCPFGCSDGACINKNLQDINGNCADSDNGNIYTKGKVIYRDENKQLLAEIDDCCDSCATANAKTGKYVVEYSCDSSGKVLHQFIACPNGCSNGACISNASVLTNASFEIFIADNATGKSLTNGSSITLLNSSGQGFRGVLRTISPGGAIAYYITNLSAGNYTIKAYYPGYATSVLNTTIKAGYHTTTITLRKI